MRCYNHSVTLKRASHGRLLRTSVASDGWCDGVRDNTISRIGRMQATRFALCTRSHSGAVRVLAHVTHRPSNWAACRTCVPAQLRALESLRRGDPYAGTHTPDSFLDLSAFKVPCTLDPAGDGSAAACLPGTQHFGTLGRNSLRGPAYRTFDVALVKNTKVNEILKVQFRAEFFNIFNHPNFGSPLYPGYSADASLNGIDSQTGRGIGFMPLTVTPDVGLGNPFLGGGGPRNIQLALKLVF